MKVYRIYDEELKTEVGCLLYFTKAKDFIIELAPGIDEWNCPLLLSAFVKKGTYTIPRNVSFMWVKERVIPSGRQNIGSLLANHKIAEYDEMKLLEISKGKCSQDSLVLKKSRNLPCYVTKREDTHLVECSICADSSLLCFFKNGKTKKTDLASLTTIDGVEKVLQKRALFESCSLAAGGRFISFDNAIDIPAEILYSEGIPVPISLEDMQSFIKHNMLDTSQCCNYLDCSRQNLAYMVREDKIHPDRYNVGGNLYRKGELSLYLDDPEI